MSAIDVAAGVLGTAALTAAALALVIAARGIWLAVEPRDPIMLTGALTIPPSGSGRIAADCVRCGAQLAPACARCHGRHLPSLPCWTHDRGHRSAVTKLVFAEHGDICCHCRRRGANSVEHLTPRSHGGSDDLDNLRPAHLTCNQVRACKPIPGIHAPTTPTTSRNW